ncbi:MAG: S9 family peptidase [Phycisphaeraceae bacterium]|nr:MAG: S9 family peptidase [Phycisphaeraceae bacterium]
MPVQITHGERDDTSPTFSPDGSRLAFVRRAATTTVDEGAEKAQKPQVWILPLKAPGEARQATDLEFGASSPRWRPDGKGLLVTSSVPFSRIEGRPDFPMERPGRDWRDTDQEPIRAPRTGDGSKPAPEKDAEQPSIEAAPDGDLRSIRNWLARNASKSNPFVISRLVFQDELTLRGEPRFSHLYSVDVAGEPRSAKLVAGGFRAHNDPRLSPDGATVWFVTDPETGEHPDREWRTAIWKLHNGAASPVLHDDAWSYDSPRPDPDGRFLLFRAVEMEDRLFRQARLGILDTQTGERRWLTADWDFHANDPNVTSSGAAIFNSGVYGSNHLYRTGFEADASGRRQLTEGPLSVGSYAESGGRIVAEVVTPENPSELYLLDADGNGSMRRLSELNTGWIAKKKISIPEERWIERPDGHRVQYWVMKPTNFEEGKTFPVVLQIHGGPMVMWGPATQSMWHEFQLLCQFGYGVVFSNPRGSSGYGYDFQKANFQDWGHGPAGDVLASLDDALSRDDWMDADQLFVTGGSYAGYLTAWIIAHDHRFKAAVAQRGVYDLVTFFGEGNAWRLVEHAFGGFPWQREIRDILERESPFTYVEKIRTPFLITHGSNDLRTGVTQSEMMYRALKELRRPVEYIRYPNAGHDLSRTGDPKQRMDRLLRIVEFFERFRENERER